MKPEEKRIPAEPIATVGPFERDLIRIYERLLEAEIRHYYHRDAAIPLSPDSTDTAAQGAEKK